MKLKAHTEKNKNSSAMQIFFFLPMRIKEQVLHGSVLTENENKSKGMQMYGAENYGSFIKTKKD